MTHDEIVSIAAGELEAVDLKCEDKGPLRFGKELRSQFLFDENYINLNHGKYSTRHNYQGH